jgi:hypothetical protein
VEGCRDKSEDPGGVVDVADGDAGADGG